jgi:hypothetical protein
MGDAEELSKNAIFDNSIAEVIVSDREWAQGLLVSGYFRGVK